MTTNKNIQKYLWHFVVIFLTYLFLGSFVVSNDFPSLIYLIIFYFAMISEKLINKNSR
ncbi:MAG: hypothetical protein Q4E75_03250 [bacterium]|nr:hypothetical protein [bacterium]